MSPSMNQQDQALFMALVSEEILIQTGSVEAKEYLAGRALAMDLGGEALVNLYEQTHPSYSHSL